MKKSYKFRIYPNRKQRDRLNIALEEARKLYNQMFDIKQQIYEGEKLSLTKFDMDYIVKDFETKFLHSQTKQNICDKLSKSYDNFFRRIKNGEKPGFPKFKSFEYYNSITFPQYKNKVSNKIHVSKIGNIKIVQEREIEGQIKTLTIKREGSEWYAILSCDNVPEDTTILDFKSEVEGIDVGLNKFLVCSNGIVVDNPNLLRKSEKSLKRIQRRLSKREKGSKNRKRQKQRLVKKHIKIKRQRVDFHRKLARNLAINIKYIGVESLSIQNMVKNHCLAKSISDAGWGSFFHWLKYYKTIYEGGIIEVEQFEPTSKECSCCGNIKKDLKLSDRKYVCFKCGLKMDRDLNASINIKKYAQIKLNTVGHTGIYAFGDNVRQDSSMKNNAVVVELGTILNSSNTILGNP